MGIFDGLRRVVEYNPTTGFAQNADITNLFNASTLASAIFPDVDTSQFPVDRASALTVPAVARALQIITSVGSRLPLKASDAAGNTVDLPWLTNTSGIYTPQKRQASMIADLIFDNHTLLAVERDADGYVISADHVPAGLWTIDQDGYICIDNKRANQSKYVFIPSIMLSGLLDIARNSIRQYLNITRTINNRTAVPEPAILIKETADLQATEAEIEDMFLQLDDALTNGRGGKVYVPMGIDIQGFGATDSVNSLMLEGREAIRKDIANFFGITVGLLDGTNGDSNTYNNAVDERNELLELTIKTWTDAIADRLSQNDVTPEGVKVSVDYSSFKTSISQGNTQTPIIQGNANG